MLTKIVVCYRVINHGFKQGPTEDDNHREGIVFVGLIGRWQTSYGRATKRASS